MGRGSMPGSKSGGKSFGRKQPGRTESGRRRFSGKVRWSVIAVATVLFLAASALIVYRVLIPHETLTMPRVPYPDAVIVPDERPFSELRAAPLVIEGRLRVYAEKWRVWSDAPVGARYESTPYWSFRRWPAQVVGVVTAPTSIGPVVLTQWSDGALIALDAQRGTIAWRVVTAEPGRGYDGRRTGSAVIYESRSLYTVRTVAGTVAVVTSTSAVTGFDVATGATLWQLSADGHCEPAIWTGAGVVVVPDCEGTGVTFVAAHDGVELGKWKSPVPGVAPRPALCELGRNECRLITLGKASGQTWLLESSGRLTPAPPPAPGAVLAGDRVVFNTANGVAARPLTSTEQLWAWTGQGELISADELGVYLLAEDRSVIVLSPATGHLTSVGCAASKPDENWQIGHAYPAGGNYLAVERVTGASADAGDQEFFYGARPVALVELYPPTKLPVWPGKYAACRRPL